MRTSRSRRSAVLRATWAIMIVLSGVCMTACFTRQVPTPAASSVPSVQPSPSHPVSEVPTISATPTPTAFTTDFVAYTLNGLIYDAAVGPELGLPQASISWHFVSADLQRFNGQTAAKPVGAYQLQLRLRPQDQIVFTASAPGYIPTTAKLHGAEIAQYGSRLNFGLVKANGVMPTVPGDVGPINISGFVYDAYRGQGKPIVGAEVQLHTISIVHPSSIYNLISDSFGNFSATLTLHSTDQVNFIIEANGYYSTTLIRNTDAISSSSVLVALQPIR